MIFLKKYFKYIALFFVFLFFYVVFFYQNCSYDVLWNYGFSHAIRIGEIPYVDFNTISTPLYAYLMSLGLFVWDDIFVFFLEQSLLIVFLFTLIFQLHGKKGWLLLPVLSLPFFLPFNPTYNFFAFFLIVLIYYLEKNGTKDYLIGILLGLLILTKHTIGLPVLFFSLISTFSWKRIAKRIDGVMVPCLLFLIVLVCTNSFFEFWNLCILGLFDFGSQNHSGWNGFFVFALLGLLFVFLNLYREPRERAGYYALGSFAFCIPIFDFYHVGLFLAILVILYLNQIRLPENYLRNMSFVFLGIWMIVYYLLVPTHFQSLTFLDLPHFRFLVVEKQEKEKIHEVVQVYQKTSNSYMLDDQSILYDIAANHKITYFDVLLKGNYGYRGTEKMIDKVASMHQVSFFIREEYYQYGIDDGQFDFRVLRYAVSNGLPTGSVQDYTIYEKE